MSAKPWAGRAAFSAGLRCAGRRQMSGGHSVLGDPTQLSEGAAGWGMLHAGCLGLLHLGSATGAQHIPQPVVATSVAHGDAPCLRRALTQPPKPAAAVRACPAGSVAKAQPSLGRFVFCLILAVSSQPVLRKTSQRLWSNHVAPLPSPQDRHDVIAGPEP